MEISHEFHKCSYCNREVLDVLTPSCNHKSCAKCLPKLILYKEKSFFKYYSDEIEIECLLCKGLLKSKREKIYELLSKLENKDYFYVAKCDKHNIEENIFCGDCEDYMCQICFDTHKEVRKFSKHQLSSIPQKLLNICTEHQKEFDFQCESCGVPICALCAFLKHKDHKSVYIKEFYQKRKEDLILKMDLPFKNLDEINSAFDKEDKEFLDIIQKESTLLVDKIHNLIQRLTVTKEIIMKNSKNLIDKSKLNKDIMKNAFRDLHHQIENLNSGDYLNLHLLNKLPKKFEMNKMELKSKESFLTEIKQINEIIDKLNKDKREIFMITL